MGASNFTYAEASWTQALADWIGAQGRRHQGLPLRSPLVFSLVPRCHGL
jgi:hypothetical protein